jgi:type IV pilus assembly protein PilE
MSGRQQGVTLIELVIVCIVTAILAIVAMSSYLGQVRNSRRIDAINTLLSISLAEERYRTTNTTYGSLAQVWGGVTASTGGYYTLAISNTSATAYTITATATGVQTSDQEGSTACTPLVLTVSAGTVTKTPASCWPS